ncbi:hypothetical protein [Bacillus cereus]|uniref:hypothetical protein n=1 Tax=Bacillus cereus TaxID=1396 RepID=UPI003172C7EA
MSTDLLQELLEVDQKAREQESIHLIQNFFNLGVSVEIIEEATSVSVEDIKRILNNKCIKLKTFLIFCLKI